MNEVSCATHRPFNKQPSPPHCLVRTLSHTPSWKTKEKEQDADYIETFRLGNVARACVRADLLTEGASPPKSLHKPGLLPTPPPLAATEMGLAFKILLLLVTVSLEGGDCAIFVKTIRQRRALLPNATSGRPTTFNHVYNIKLPYCRNCSANVAQPLARIFEARDEAWDDQSFEHTVDPTNQVVFTHRINIPPQACGCDDIQALLNRLEVLEKQVLTLERQCSGRPCCGMKRMDCGAHGRFSSSSCSCVCDQGWTGPTCAKANCPASCHPPQGDCVDGRCVCRQGFTGEDCSKESCPDDCNDQGRCIDDECVCFPGYTGYGCTEQTCPDDCRDHGKCVNGRCVCDKGYSGFDCRFEDCPEDCSGQGRCLDGKCVCNTGFSGRDCSLPACPSNCHRRGNCVNGKCVCRKGFTGPDCSLKTCPENCNNRGRCVNGKCACNTGYSGAACGTQTCPENCNNRGRCVNGKCVCNTGYSGAACGTQTCPENCNNRGRCVNGKCICNTGYSGPSCGTQTCPENCNNRGRCVNGKCVCNTGYSGPSCGVQTCPENCNNRGRCVNGKCACNTGYSGAACGTQTCPENCNNRGRCVNGKCVCNTGYSGPSCGTQTCPENCNNRGRCVDGKCVCNTGYSGPSCGTQTCPENCNNRGRCVDGKCVCKDGFAGNDCSIEIPATIRLHVKKVLENKATVGWELPQVPVDAWEITFRSLGYHRLDDPLHCGSKQEERSGVRGHLLTAAVERDQLAGFCHGDDGRGPGSPLAATPGFLPPDVSHPSQQKEDGDQLTNLVAGSKSTFQQTGLASGQEYEVTVRAKKGKRLGPAVSRTLTTLIDGPRNFHVVSATNSTIELGWKKPEASIDHYRLNYSSATGKRSQVVVPASNSSIVLTGLEAGVEHTIFLVGEKGQHQSKAVATKGTTVIDSPRNLRVVTVTDSSIKLQWEKSVASDGHYHIVYSSEGRKRGELRVPGKSSTATLVQLEGGTKYTISLVGEQGTMRSKPVITKATTGGTQGKLARGYSSPTEAASENQLVQNISRTISKKIMAGELSAADVGPVMWSVIRRYPAFPKEVRRSTKVLLNIPNTGIPQVSSRSGRGPGRHRGSNVVGSPAVSPKKPKGGVAGSPGDREAIPIPSPQQTHNGTVSPPSTRTPEPNKPEIFGDSPPTAANDPLLTIQSSSPTQAPSDLRPFDLPDLTTAVNSYHVAPDDKLLASITDQVAHFRNVTVRDVTPQAFRLSWKVPEGAFDSFVVQYRVATGSVRWEERKVQGRFRSVLLKGLLPGTDYTIRLYGVQDGQRTGPTALNVTTDSVEPVKVGKLGRLTFSDITERSLRLAWTADRDFDTFLVHYRIVGSKEVHKLKLPGNLRSSLITDLRPGTKYSISLHGISSGQRTKPISSTTTTTEGVKLGSVSTSDITANSLRLSWTVDRAHFDSFLIQYRVQSSEETQNITVTGGQRSHLIVGLKPTTRYTIYLYGISDGVRTEPLTTTVTTSVKVQPQWGEVRDLSVSDITADSLQLSWVTERQYDSFFIEYRAEEDHDLQSLTVRGDHRSATITGLRPTTKYTLYVYGVSAGQHTAPLSVVATTTDKDAARLKKVGQLSVSNVTSDSFQLSWAADGAFDSFVIQYRVPSSKVARKRTVTGDSQRSVITGLRPSTSYRVFLFGVSHGQRTRPLTALVSTRVLTGSVEMKPSRLENLSTFNTTVHLVGLVGLPRGLRPATKYTVHGHGLSHGQAIKPLSLVLATEGFNKHIDSVDPGLVMIKILLDNADVYTSTDKDKVKPSKVNKLENLSVSNVTADSFQLSWGAEKDLDSFLIQYRVRGSEDVHNMTVTGDRRLSVITGLRPSTMYTVYVYGISAGIRSKPLNTLITTKASTDKDKVKPSKVNKLENLSVSNVTADSFQLSWGAEKDFDSFLIQYGVRGSDDVHNVMVTGDRRLSVITGLRPSTVYTVYVYGISAGVRSKPLNTFITTKATTDKVKVKPSKANKLENLSVSNITADSFQLSWGAEKDFDSFLIQYRVRGSEDVHNVTVTGDRGLSVITGLRPSTVYTVYVYGISAGVRSKPLNTFITTKASTDKDKVKPSKVNKLENLSVSNVKVDSFQLSWRVEKGFDSFLIQYRVRGSENVHNVTVSGDHRLSVIPGLRPSTTYTVYVYGISAGVRSKPLKTLITTKASTDKDKVKPSKMNKLKNFSVSNIKADSFQLSWGAEKGFDSFLIQYRVQDSKDLHNVTVTGDRRLSVITGLRPRTMYTVYVYGISAGARSKPVKTLITTKASTDKDKIKPIKVNKLENLSVSNVTADSFQLSWGVDKDFDSFHIHYEVRGSEDVHNVTVTGDRRLSVITGLRPSTVYTVYVYGISAGVRSKPLNTLITTKASTDKDKVKPSKVNKLENLSVSNITVNSFQLSWGAEKEFDSFLIQYRIKGSEDVHNVTVTGDRRLSVITGLRPNTVYRVYVYGISAGVRSKPLNTLITTKASTDKDKVKPSKVSKLENLSVSNITVNSFQLSWGAEKDFDSFHIQYRVRGSEYVHNVTVTGDRRLSVITGLRPSTMYRVYVYGISAGVRSKPLNTFIATKASTDKDKVKPSKVNKLENLSVSNITVNSFQLSWGAEKEFDSFLIQYRIKGSEDVHNVTVTGDRRLSVITGLRPRTAYTVYVYGISAGVRSKPLNTLITTKASTDKDKVKPSKVNKLENLSVSNVTADSFQLSWGAEKDFDSFHIQYGVRGSEDVHNETVTGDRRLSVITGLRPSTMYRVYVYGISAGVRSKPLNTFITTKASTDKDKVKPSKVNKLENLSVSNITVNSFQLSWGAEKEFDSFLIQYRVKGSEDVHNVTVTGGRRLSVITGLRPNTVYRVYVYGISAGVRSKPLNTLITTKASTDKDKVKPSKVNKLENLSVSNVTADSFQLSWGAEKDFDSFHIQYGVRGSEDVHNVTVTGDRRLSVITGLRPRIVYRVYVYGISAGVRSKPLNTLITTKASTDKDKVKPSKVNKLENLSVSNITVNSFQLSWGAEKEFDSFLIQYRVKGSEDVHNVTVTGGRRLSVITGLRPNTVYRVYVYGISAGVRSKPLNTLITTKASTDKDKVKPSKVNKLENLSVSNVTVDSFQLSWGAEKDFDSFHIQYGVRGSEDVHNVTVTGDRRLSVITGLSPSTMHTVYVYGISAGVRSKPLNTLITTKASTDKDKVKPSKVNKLENLSVSNITVNSFQLSWGAEKEFDSFLIQYRVKGSEDVHNVTVTGDRRLSVITGLRPRTAYTVYVYGISAGVRSKPLNTLITTKASTDKDKVKPSKVNKLENLSVSNVTEDSFQLSWGAEKDFDSFHIQYGVRGSEDVHNVTVTGDRRLSVITGLRPRTVYRVYVYGISAGVRSKPLNTLITTKASTDKDKVKPSKVNKLENLSVSNITVNSFQLSWGAEKLNSRVYSVTDVVQIDLLFSHLFSSTDKDKVKPSKVNKLENLSVSNVTADSFQLSWGPEKDFDSFLIQYRVRGSEDVHNVTVTGDRGLSVITGLRPSTMYTVYVYGISAGVHSKPLNTLITTKASTDKDKVKPSKVNKLENLSVSNITADSFQLSWGAEKDFDSFLIQYGVQGSEDVHNVTVTGDRRLSVITGLRPSTVYTVYVYGISAGVRSKPLNTLITTKAFGGKPSDKMKPGRLSFLNITSDSVQLFWLPQRGTDFYILQYRVRSSATVQNVTLTGDRRSFKITGLSPATKYLFSLYRVSGGQYKKPLLLPLTTKASPEKAKPKPQKEIELGALSVSNVTADSTAFSWTAEKGFDAFLIRYKVHGSGAVQNFTVTGGKRSATITGLRPSTKYTLYVYGVSNGKRTKPLSRVITTKASKDKEAVKLGSVSTSDIIANSLRLSWTVDRAHFDSFLIQYRVQGSEETQNITVTGRQRSHLIVGLKPTTRYTIYLYGISDGVRTEPLTTTVTTSASAERDTTTPAQLGSVSTSDITANTLRLSWTVDRAHFDSFLIQYRVQGSEETQNITVTGGQRSHLIVGLKPTTRYTIYLYGVFNGKHSKPLTAAVATTASTDKEGQKPLPVVDLGKVSVSKVTADSLKLSWETERSYDSFLIEYGPEGLEDVSEIPVTGDRRSAVITGLRPSTTYRLRVYGLSGDQRSRPLTTSAKTTATAAKDTVKPSKLGDLSVSHITAQSFKLSWTASEGFDSFLIEYSTSEPRGVYNLTMTGDQRSTSIKGLRPTTVYTVRLYGVAKGQRTKPLTSVVTTTDKAVVKPVKLRPLSVSTVAAHSVRVSWTTDLVFRSFLIEYRIVGSRSVQNVTVMAHRRSYLITGLRPSTKYTVTVYGISRGQRTALSTSVITTRASTDKEGQRPLPVVDLGKVSVSKVTADSLKLSWETERSYDSFLIEYGPEGSEDVSELPVTGDRRSAVITGLKPSTTYRLHVYGLSGDQRSRPLTTSTKTTDKAVVKPVKLRPLSVSSVTAHSVRVSWTTELVFGSFLIEYRIVGSRSVQNVTVMAHRRSYLITGLRPSTKYTVTVYGISRGQRTALSTSVITTRASTDKEGQRPHTVVDLGKVSVSKVTTDSLKLSWETERSYDSFLIEYGPEGSEDVSELPVTGDRRSAVITGLRPSTTYRLHVYGLSGDQSSRPLTTSTKTTDKAGVKPVKLRPLSVSSVTAQSVRVSWTTELVFGSFLIEYRIVGSRSVQNVTVMAHRRSYLITGLRPSTKYTITVYGISRGQRTALSTSVITTRASTDKEGQRPLTVVDLGKVSVSKVTADSLKLSWETERSYDSFLIEYGPEGSEDVSKLLVTGDHRSAVITGLRPSTTYRLHVYGLSGDQRSRPLTTSSKTTDKAVVKPVKLRPLSVSTVTAHSVRVSWTTDLVFGSFLIEYRIVGSRSVQNVTVMAHRRSYLITGLRPSTKYTVTVYGISRGQRTALSTSVITTRASTDKEGQRPLPVVDLGKVSVSKVTADSLKLSWETERSYDSFLIEYGPEGSEDVSELPVTSDRRSAVITGLRPSTTYRLNVYGLSGDQRSRPLTTSTRTTDKAVVKPVKLSPLSVSTVKAQSVRVSWTTELVFGSFLIEYRIVGSRSVQNVTVMAHRRSYLITGLRPSTKYTITVYGISRGQRTALSTSVITTRASTDKEGQRPLPVVDLGKVSVSKVTADSLKLSWETERSYDSFLIEYGPEGSEDVSELLVTGDRRSAVITGLRPSTTYRLHVYGLSGDQRSRPLTTSTKTTDKAVVKPVKLRPLSVSTVTAHSVRVSWTTDLVFGSFLIEYRIVGSRSVQNVTVMAHRRSYLITGLRPSTKYTVTVYGISRGQRPALSTSVITTRASTDKEGQRPLPVVDLGKVSVSKVTADSLKLSWETERSYDSFLIEYGPEGSEDVSELPVTSDRRSAVITGLRPSTTYRLNVYGLSGDQCSRPLTTSTRTTDKAVVKPVKLSPLSVSTVKAQSVRVSWTTELVFGSFLIEYRIVGSRSVQNVTVMAHRRSYLITGLRPSTKYTITVYGISRGQRTALSTSVITTRASTDKEGQRPLPVVDLGKVSVSKVTADSLKLSWETERSYDSFLIEYGPEGSEDVSELLVTGDRRSAVITGLRPSTTYRLHVYGLSGDQRSRPLTTSTKTTDKAVVKPVKLRPLSVSTVTAHSVRVSWTTELVFGSFLIEYRIVGSRSVQNVTVMAHRRSYLITGLRPSTKYTVTVYGISRGQRTALSTSVITTRASAAKDTVKPNRIGDLSVSRITAQSFKLSWTASEGFDSFLIEYSASEPRGVYNLTMTGDQRSTFIKGLRPTTVYTVRLYGVAKGQRTKPLTSIVTTTASTGTDIMEPSEKKELGNISALALTPHSVRLSWAAQRDYDSYIVQYRARGSELVQKQSLSGHTQSHVITGLRPTTKYTFYLYGVSSGRHTTPLSTTVTTADSSDEVSPTAKTPVRPGVSHVTADSLQLSWMVGQVYELFLIQYRAHGSQTVSNLTVAGDQRSFFITGLKPSTKYTIYLHGVFQGQVTKLMAFVASTTVKEGIRPSQVKALGSLSVSNITADSLELSWSTQWAFDSYVIQYRAQGSEEVRKFRVSGNRRSYVLIGLRPTTKYAIYIYGVSRGRHTRPLSIVVTTTASIDTNGVKPSRLRKLIRLSGNNVTQDSLQIFWAAESGFDSFLIQYRVEGSEEVQNFTVPAHQHSSFIEGLRPGTKYLVSLYGLSGSRRTRPLTTIITTAASAEKELVKSGKFGSLSFSNITADSLLLSWSADTVFDSFLIQYKAQGSDLLQNITVTGDRRSVFITGLRPTTNYTIYLYGVSNGQLSRPLVALLTITAVPVHTVGVSALGRLSVSDINTHSLKLSWAVEEGTFDSFLVQYRDSEGQLGVKEVTVPGNLRSVSIGDLAPSTEYLISLYGVLQNQQTEPIPIVARTARESPSRLSFSDLTDSSVTVHWAAPAAPVDSFKIFYVPTKRGEPRSAVIAGRKTNITLRDLLPDTQYEVNLVAVRGATESPPILDHFTTAPDAPTNLKAVNISETMALLVWRPAIAPIDHYTITYSSKAGATVSRDVPGNSAQLQLTGLTVNTEYTADISSVSGDRMSPRVTTNFVTGSDLPKDLTVSDISTSEALVSWKSPRAPVTGYLLLYGTEGDLSQRVKLDATKLSHRLQQLMPSTRYMVRLHALQDSEKTGAVTAHFNTVGAHIPFPKDCGEERSNGRTESSIVTLYLNGSKDKPIRAYCDMETDGGGWLVFQRRMDGKTNFIRNWKAYETGFGDPAGEHWLGLLKLHQLTAQQNYQLRVDLRNGQESAYAIYDNFLVESPAERYKLSVGKYSGNAGNSLAYHHGSNFTTIDADNDEALTNCAVSYRGGWWYKNCHRVNLNGEYGNNRDHQGVNWYSWKGFEFSIPFTEMKMRPYKFVSSVRKE
ncbi:tenascin-X-like [Hemiscyllium ocellatum]|uniref:tenascin-X-like n=1 Tax=Hemiscyllium ocellatum TaxID=170820 RepID=UPI0029661A7D|nr:tenascin-X-like [Hemiscyllium ocellatum]